MSFELAGIIILNDSIGISIDDAIVESQSTFVARTKVPWHVYPQATWITRLAIEIGVKCGNRGDGYYGY